MGKQKRGKIPKVSSFGRMMNIYGKISTPAFRKNSNVAQVEIYGKKHYVHVLVCHTFHGPPPSEAEQEVLHLNQHSDFRPDDSYMHANARFLKFGTHSQNIYQSYRENKTRGSSAPQKSIPILGKKMDDDDQWVAYASASEAARIIGETHGVVIHQVHISAVVNGKRNQTAGFVFKKDTSRTLPEVFEGEVWKPSRDGTSVSNMQRFKNAKGHIIVPKLNSGHEYVAVMIKGKKLPFHQVVCEAFHGPMPVEGGHTVDHIDRNPLNNTPENLRWATRQEQRVNQREERKSNAPKRSKPILGREVMSDAACWIPFASAHDAARQLGLYPGSVSAVVNGQRKTVGNATTGKRYEFMLDEAAAEPEILTDDDGHVEEWRPVKKWKFVDGTWVDIFANF